MHRVRVATDRWNFELDGTEQFITPIGGNILNDQHPSEGTFFQHFDADDVDYRLGVMSQIGLNCLRQAIGVNEVYDAATGLKADGLRNWDTFIALAEKHGIYLMPVGGYLGSNDWFDAELLADNGKPLDDACRFWDAFTGHYAGHPAIWAWDLRNELLYSETPHMVEAGSPDAKRIRDLLLAEWPAWLETRYGTVEAMNRAYGANHGAFSEVPGSVLFVEKPFDAAAYDFRLYMNDRGYAWAKRQVDVIRAATPHHMVCSGNNGWLFPDMDLWLANGFHNRAHHDLYDFVTIHPYPAPQCVPGAPGDPLDGGEKLEYWLNACIGMARIDYYGKPVVLQEFGWYGGGKSQFLCPLPYRSEAEHADYTRTLCQTLLPHVNGYINWPTMDMPAANDISNHGGIFTHDGKRKALANVYEDFARDWAHSGRKRASGTKTLTYSLSGVYTSRGYQDQMWAEIVKTLNSGEVPDFRFIGG